jgi:hypothetical protein
LTENLQAILVLLYELRHDVLQSLLQ